MKKLVFIAFLLIFTCDVYAQTDSLGHYNLIQLDSILATKKNAKEKKPYALAMFAQAEKTMDKSDTAYAKKCTFLGNLYIDLYGFSRAVVYFEQSAAIWEAKNPGSTAHIKSLQALGFAFAYCSDYEKAEKTWLKALNICKRAFGEDNETYAGILMNIGGLSCMMGHFAKAEPIVSKALSIYKALIGEKNAAYTLGLNTLATIYHNNANFSKAAESYLKVLEIQKEISGDKDTEYAKFLNNLALLYLDINDNDRAKVLFTQTLDIYKNTLGENNPNYAETISALAAVYYKLKDYTTAHQLYKRGMEIVQDIFGKEGLSYAASLEGLGKIEFAKENYSQARQYYLTADTIYKQIYGEHHAFYAGSLQKIANLYETTGNYEKAEAVRLQMLAIFKNAFGEHHTDYTHTLNDLGKLYENTHNYKQAQTYYASMLPSLMNVIDMQSAGWDEKGNQRFFNSLLPCINNANTFAAFHIQHDSLLRLIQNAALFTKSYALMGTKGLLPLIKTLKDSSLNAAYDAWIYTKNRLGKAYDMDIHQRSIQGINIDSLEQLAADQEAALMRSSAALRHRLGYEKKRFSYKDLQAAIAKNEIAIDFIRFENADTAWYYALINQQGWAFPKYIALCTEAQLMDYVGTEISLEKESYISNHKKNKELYALLIKPLEPYLKKIKSIHWSPVGLMNQLALGTLRDDKGKMLLEKFTTHQYSSLKDFIVKRTSEGNTGSLLTKDVLLVGDVAFDLDEAEHLNLAKHEAEDYLYASRSVPVDSSRGTSRFVRLGGTKLEVEKLNLAFSSKKWTIKQLQEKDALEENVRSFSGDKAPLVLHFATHGFFIPAPKYGHDNPLLRSGIALAGANRAWLGKPRIEGVEDGLWTAYEVANTDLTHTDLVVLSACETARGYIDPHEGVVGLQRSFKIAGVDNMLLSLWQVPDKETVELMEEFYKYYLNGESPAASLHKAQQTMRKRYPDPYYWAAFVLIE